PKGPASPLPAAGGPRTPHARQPRRTTAMPRKRKQTPPAPPTDNVVSEARRESAALLNLNPGDLSPAGALKCDMVSALRLVIDDELARATSGSGADLGKLITAVEHLAKLLPREPEPEPVEPDEVDPRQKLKDIVRRYLEAKAASRSDQGLSPRVHDLQSAPARLDDLETELVRLRGSQPHALPAPEAERGVIDPPTGAITPPGEVGEFYVGGPRPGPDDPKPPVTIDHEGRPLRPGSQMLPDGRIVPIPQAKSGA